jgi:hypothetical protein
MSSASPLTFRPMRRLIRLLPATIALAALAAMPVRTPAAVSVAGGGYAANNPTQSGLAAIVSSSASVPNVPLQVQGSLFLPLGGRGGYAATAEIRGLTGGGYGGAYVGAGIGVGDMARDRSSGTVFTIFAGKSIAPLTSIELRLYKQTQDTGATAGFVGFRFSF